MRNRHISVAAIGLLLVACAKPLPPERLAYAGEWSGPGITLRVFPDGNVKYRREEGSTKVSINAPIKAFKGDDFVVGVGRLLDGAGQWRIARAGHARCGRRRARRQMQRPTPSPCASTTR